MFRRLPPLVAALALGLASSFLPRPVVAQDADAVEKPSASSKTEKDHAASKSKKTDSAEPERIVKTPEEWRKLLTYEQFLVTRMKATEPAFSGKYALGHHEGTFLCVCCEAKLFDSRTKFESGTGWPSFWQPISPRALARALDQSEFEPRIEVMCARCGAHLGHVFEDGPPPTGLRFCVNSLSLKLDPEPAKTTAKKASARGSRRRATPSASRNSASKSSKSTKSTAAEKPASKDGDS